MNTRLLIGPVLLASVCCVALILSPQSRDEPPTPALTYDFANASGQTSIPFELTGNKVYVPVVVNKTGPHWFILDTGSWSNVLDSEVAKVIGVPLKDSFEVSGAGEKTLTGATGSNVSLQMAGLELSQTKIEVEPINAAVSSAEGRRVDGLLGYDFFRRFVVQVDYVHRQMKISEPSAFHYTGSGDVLPIEIVRGNILISASLTMPNGKAQPGSFLVDTAWRSALTLATPFVANQKLLTMVSRSADATTGMGIGGPTVDTIARIPGLKLGRYAIENLVASFSHAKAGVLSQTDFAGIIGAEILRRFTVTFDYPQQRLILESNAAFSSPYEFDMSGLFVTTQDPASGAFTVLSVIKDSPAMQAGIRVGDLIEAIDDRPAKSFTLDQARQLFKAPEGQGRSIRVKRGRRVFVVKFRLHRIV